MTIQSRAEIAQLLRQLADTTREFMRTPTFWNFSDWEITENTVIDLVHPPSLLGDRYSEFVQPLLKKIRQKCLVAGFGDMTEATQTAFKAAIDYLNAASDFLNRVPRGCPARDVVPEIVASDYTLMLDTPVDDFVELLQDLANELAGPDRIIDSKELAEIAGCTSDDIRDALAGCLPERKGKKGSPKAWWYLKIAEQLQTTSVKSVSNYPWPDSASELSGKILERK